MSSFEERITGSSMALVRTRKRKKKKRGKKERGREKDTEFSWFEYTTVRGWTFFSTTSDTRYVRKAIPPDDASEVSFPGMTTEGVAGLKKKGRVSLTISRCANIILRFKKRKNDTRC